MTRTDLYKLNGMDIWGDSFELDISSLDISTEEKIFELLDQVCIMESKHPLQGGWWKISFADCCTLLQDAFHYDLAFTYAELMSNDKAIYFQELLTTKINSAGCHCYTNWNTNPWKENNGCGYNTITDNTFDMAIVLLDSQKLIFTYFISED
jgi:hypothetical protein